MMSARRWPALATAAVLALSLSSAAQAHRQWLVPSATALSADDVYVTVDAAISNELFHPDHFAMPLDGLQAIGPDGKPVALENAMAGRYRTTFDVPLAQRGTYKIHANGGGVMAMWKENGENKRWRGSADQLATAVPKGAKDLRVIEMVRHLETYVTNGAPTTEVFALENRGLELRPVTHPNDLVDNEAATFQLLLDGKPAADLEVEVVPGNRRYRNSPDEMTVKTDADGRFSVTFPAPGMYWLNASVSDGNTSLPGASRRASYTATMEVLPQ